MIARMWRGWVRTEQANAYVAYITGTGMREYEATPGNLGCRMWTRDLGGDRTEVLTVGCSGPGRFMIRRTPTLTGGKLSQPGPPIRWLLQKMNTRWQLRRWAAGLTMIALPLIGIALAPTSHAENCGWNPDSLECLSGTMCLWHPISFDCMMDSAPTSPPAPQTSAPAPPGGPVPMG